MSSAGLPEKGEQPAPDAEAPAAGCSDAPPSNTASDKCNGYRSEGFRPMWQGIDTLQISFKGRILPSVESTIEKLKELAQSADEEDQASAQYAAGGEVFQVTDKGSPGFPYTLKNARFHIRLSGYLASRMPLAAVQVQSAYLALVGARGALTELKLIIEELGEISGQETVSRADLTVDFTTSENIPSITPEENWVTTAEEIVRYQIPSSGRLKGFQFGPGADTSARLYDKVLQIVQMRKGGHFHAIWERAGRAPWEPVWRMEFQLKRSVLARRRIRTVDELVEALPGLWLHLTTRFLRLTVPSARDKTRSRWPNHGLWDDVASIRWEGKQSPLTLKPVLTEAPSDEWLGRQAAMLVTSMMGREGLTDPKLAAALVFKLMYAHVENREGQLGRSPEQALCDKSNAKARKYGTRLNSKGAGWDRLVEREALQYKKLTGRE